jgi:hypothetical protein
MDFLRTMRYLLVNGFAIRSLGTVELVVFSLFDKN